MHLTAAGRVPAHGAAAAGSRLVLARHTVSMLPVGPVLTGCLTGIGMTAVLAILAGPAETPAALAAGLRISFVPLVAGVAFLLTDPHRPLTGALPARPWLVPALRVAMAVPPLAASAAVQLILASRALSADLRAAGLPRGALPWPALAGELGAWCLVAVAFAAGLERTRWRDLAGLMAAVATMIVVGIALLVPFHWIPTPLTGMTAGQHRHWLTAWWVWTAVAAIAAVAAGRGAGDPWRRWSWRPRRAAGGPIRV